MDQSKKQKLNPIQIAALDMVEVSGVLAMTGIWSNLR